jgi:hypothetical protein
VNPLSALLAAVLLLAVLAKLREGSGPGAAASSALGRLLSTEGAVGVWRAVSVAEAAVGICLLTFPASRVPAVVATTMLLAASCYALLALKKAAERPCGCFGVAIGEPTTALTLARALLLTATAATIAAVGGHWKAVVPLSWWLLAAAVEALALTAMSPDLRAIAAQLVRRQMASCLTSYVPLERCKVLLSRSRVWKRLEPLVDGAELVDHWRDGCWSFLCFRTSWKDDDATAMFAIRVPPGPQHVRAILVDDRTGHVIAQDHEIGRRWPWPHRRRESNQHAFA